MSTPDTTDNASTYYDAPNPYEHYDSARTSRFLETRAVEEIAGSQQVALNARYTSGDYPKLYNVFTRDRHELFAYGGYVSEGSGAYVAKNDIASLMEVWRTYLTLPDHWNYPGAMAVLGDGYVYAVAGNLPARVDSETGEASQLSLPQRDDADGAAYNGFTVSPDGVSASGLFHRRLRARRRLRLGGELPQRLLRRYP
jgi:hypothetical protein